MWIVPVCMKASVCSVGTSSRMPKSTAAATPGHRGSISSQTRRSPALRTPSIHRAKLSGPAWRTTPSRKRDSRPEESTACGPPGRAGRNRTPPGCEGPPALPTGRRPGAGRRRERPGDGRPQRAWRGRRQAANSARLRIADHVHLQPRAIARGDDPHWIVLRVQAVGAGRSEPRPGCTPAGRPAGRRTQGHSARTGTNGSGATPRRRPPRQPGASTAAGRSHRRLRRISQPTPGQRWSPLHQSGTGMRDDSGPPRSPRRPRRRR